MRMSPGLGARAVVGVVGAACLFVAIGYGLAWALGLAGLHLSAAPLQVVVKGAMALAAVGLWALMGRRARDMGWKRATNIRWARLAGAYGVAAVSMGLASWGMIFSGARHPVVSQMTFVEIVLAVWVCSSVGEEIFVRGLVQSWIGEGARGLPGDRRVVVLASAGLFAAMHVPLMWRGAGLIGGGITVLATFGLGWAAARVRESTGSLVHAIGVHVFGNAAAVPFGIAAVVLYRVVTGHLPVR